MHRLRGRSWRRLVALGMILCFAFARLEASLPDWDGGMPMATLPFSTVVDHGDDHPPDEVPHTCHCSHAHENAPSVPSTDWATAVARVPTVVAALDSYLSTDPPATFRPPIV